MNTRIEKLPKSKVKINFQVPKEMVDKYIEMVYKEKAKNVDIQGFRPGHAPRYMIEAKIGTAAIYNKALERLFPFAYAEAITKEKIIAVGHPEVKVIKFAPNNPAEFEATVAVLPEVKLGNYKNLVIERRKIKIEKNDIEKVLENLRKKEASLKEKTDPAEKGDWVEIDFSGSKNGVILEKLVSKNHPLVIGEGSLLPDFETEIIGLKKSEEKTFKLDFPLNYNDNDLAGQNIEFKIKVNNVQKIILPEINDEFAQKISGSQDKNLTQLKVDIEKALESQKKQEERIRVEEEAITQVTEKAQIDIPDELIEQEKNQAEKDFIQKLESQGLSLEKYLEFTKKNKQDLEENLKKEAKRKIKIGLVLNKIAEEEGIEVTEEEREAEVKRIQNIQNNNKEDNTAFKQEETRRYVTIILKHRKAIEKLLEYAEK